jgi:hypothetical protein
VNAPKRWSSAGSEVDPVVRSLIGYAKGRAPSAVDVERLATQVTARRERALPRPGAWRARVRLLASVAAAVAFGGIAWAGLGPTLVAVFRPAPSVSTPPPLTAAEQRARSTKRGTPAPAPTPATSAPLLADPEATRALSPEVGSAEAKAGAEPHQPPKRERSAPSAAASAPAVDELATLGTARRLLATDPGRALALTEASAREVPKSQFAEERSAIAIEALQRLGRLSEAEARLESFEQRFPESLYRRRLRARVVAP